jgi:hypothetical protein
VLRVVCRWYTECGEGWWYQLIDCNGVRDKRFDVVEMDVVKKSSREKSASRGRKTGDTVDTPARDGW